MSVSVTRIRQIIKAILVDKLGNREICRQLKEASSTVSRYCKLAEACCLSYDELSKLSDKEFLSALKNKPVIEYIQPDLDEIERYFRSHKKVTLEKAIEAVYFSIIPQDGQKHYSLAHVYDLFLTWNKEIHGVKNVSSIPCNPGDILEVDFVGDDLHWIDGDGISHKARVFVGAYKYSGFFYAEAFENEKVTSWLHGIVNTLEKYGVPRAISFDNARALVSKPDRYIAELSVSMFHLCDHYSLIPNSCKVRHPTHKNVAEYSVGLTERAFANLESFTGAMFARDLKDVNQKLQQEIDIINKTPFKENGKGSRYLSYQNYERPQLKVPPLIPFEICEPVKLLVDGNGWVKVDGNKRYLVHYSMRRKEVVAELGYTTISFYNPKTYVLCGRYARDYSPNYASHKDESMLNPVEVALTKGLDETVKEFRANGHATTNILKYLKEIFNDQNPAISKYKLVMGMHGLCKSHGVTVVDEACAQAAREGKISDYQLIKKIIHESITRINAHGRVSGGKSSTAKKEQNIEVSQQGANTSNGMKLRGVNYFKGGYNHESD